MVQGAYERDVITHSCTSLWYKERTVAIQAGSLITPGVSLPTENSRESRQDEFHKTCMHVIRILNFTDK